MTRAGTLVLMSCFALAACESGPSYYWWHTSGVQNGSKLELDDTICSGVARGSVPAATTYPKGRGFGAGLQAGSQDAETAASRAAVHRGCMAERGWVLRQR